MAKGQTTAASATHATPNGSIKPVSVLFVCLGNICRSTMSEGVFQSLTRPPLATLHPLVRNIDSCGTGAYHIGEPANSRTMRTLKKNNITNYKHAARQFRSSDFAEFDYIMAMDDDNLEDLLELRAREVKKKGSDEGVGKVMLFGDFGGNKRKNGRGEEVDDPYYGGDDGFEKAYEQAGRFSKAFLEALERGELS